MKKFAVLFLVLTLALGTAGAAVAATPWATWQMGGSWDVAVSVTEFPASDEVFIAEFDPTLRNSFLELQAGFEYPMMRAVLPLIGAFVPSGGLQDATDFLNKAPYDMRMAVAGILDNLMHYIAKEEFDELRAEIIRHLKTVYTPIPVSASQDIVIGEYSEVAADAIVNALKLLFDVMDIVEGVSLDVVIDLDVNPTFGIGLGLNLSDLIRALEKFLFEGLLDKYWDDISALLGYVLENPTILQSLGAYQVGGNDPLMLLSFAKDSDVLLGMKTGASANGSGTMNIIAAKVGELETISTIDSSYLLTGGVPVSWTADNLPVPTYAYVPMLQSVLCLLSVGDGPGLITSIMTTKDSFVMTMAYPDVDTYYVESYTAQRTGTTPPGPIPPGPSGGGSSGCNAGMMPMLLLGLAVIPFFRKR